MSSIKVNADYESVLFQNAPQPKVNEVIEFLAFFLEEGPFLITKKYPESFLDYLSDVRGSRPVMKTSGPSTNWWGELKDFEMEKWLNSKVTSTELSIRENWVADTYVLRNESDVNGLPERSIPMLTKSPFDMSGRGFRFFPTGVEKDKIVQFPVILEPLLDRKFDFSHYVFPNGKEIAYQNIVDKKFQYKGTLFRNWKKPDVENLSFYNDVPKSEWDIFKTRLEIVKAFYSAKVSIASLAHGFSVDSLIHQKNNELLIHAVCELNFRRTMGRVAYDLSERFAGDKTWTLFLLLPKINDTFEKLKPALSRDGLILLSPPGSRFEVLFLMAKNEEKGKALIHQLRDLLSLVELPINI